MKALRKTGLLLAMLACALVYAAQPEASAYAQSQPAVGNNVRLVFDGKVINVHDGDTVTVLNEGKKKNIRLQGIDAPELKQAFGSVSQQNLSRMVLGKDVTIVWTKIDKYRRTVGTIMLDGRDMNIEQVRAGLAWHFKKYEDEQSPEDRRVYSEAEVQARSAKLGLWRDLNPTPPGDWRADVKTTRWGPAPPEGTIIGSRNSKKYHRPDCPGYRDMAERNRVFFKTVAEAEQAGYKRAGNCPAEVTPLKSSNVGNVTPAGINPAAVKSVTPISSPNGTPNGAQVSIGQVIGNKNSKIYHLSNCPGYDSVAEKNRQYFQSSGEAEKAGYRKAKNCQ